MALAMAVGLGLFPVMKAAAQSVPQDLNGQNVFELDGNVAHDASTVPPWDWAPGTGDASGGGLFNYSTSTNTFTQPVAPGTTAGGATLIQSSLCNDAQDAVNCNLPVDGTGNTADLAFITGASKDTIDPNGNWTCTDKPVTPKDEIDNAYASMFTEPNGHIVMYQAIERGVVNGTSNAGFWVFQGSPQCKFAPGATTGTFVGGHRNGDILVFATFNSGGNSVTVDVFGWEDGALTTSPILSGTTCVANSTATDANGSACGITNTSDVTTPWPPHNSTTTAIQPNGFFEVGVDLTDFYAALAKEFGVSSAVPCLSEFLADTRASGSQGNAVNSALHDYISGNFNTCSSKTTTTPQKVSGSAGSNTGSYLLGATVKDQAVVVPQLGSFSAPVTDNPTGNVNFYVCGPGESAQVAANAPYCSTSGTSLGTKALASTTFYTSTINTTYSAGPPATVTDSSATWTANQWAGYTVSAASGSSTVYARVASNTTTTLTLTSEGWTGTTPTDGTTFTLSAYAATSSNFTPTQTGTYCFLGQYVPDSSSIYGGSSDSRLTECFSIEAVTPPLNSTMRLDDTVEVQAAIATEKPTGSVTFTLSGPFPAQPSTSNCGVTYTALSADVTYGTDESGNQTVTVSPSPDWAANQWAGYSVAGGGGSASGVVASNTADTITLTSAGWTPSAPTAGDFTIVGVQVTVPGTSETFDSSNNGFFTTAVNLQAYAPGTTSPAAWYAWGAKYSPDANAVAYTSANLACTAEEANVQYATGSGGLVPAGS